ncbi:MAG: hypothetical protein V3S27_08135 [Kiloniellales bacterium]
MLAELTHEDFARCLNERFRLHTDSTSHDLRLFQVKPLGAGRPGGRPPFSLLFRAPQEALFPQMIYRLENDRLGALDLFLIPLGPDAHGMVYDSPLQLTSGAAAGPGAHSIRA